LTATLFRKVLLPWLIPGLVLAAGSAGAECLTDDWVLYAATGDVAAIETTGSMAWVAAKGGVIRIDLTNLALGNPDQFKITDQEGLVSADVTCLTVDGFGNVYVGTRTAGVSVFDRTGRHLADLFSFDQFLWSNLVTAIDALGDTTGTHDLGDTSVVGDKIVVASVDSYSPQGTLEGGGLREFYVSRLPGGGFGFTPGRSFPVLPRIREVLVEPGVVWVGTTDDGLKKRDEATGEITRVVGSAEGLASTNVKRVVRAPAAGLPGTSVLWLATGAGLYSWNGAALDSVSGFQGLNILDVYGAGTDLWALTEQQPTPNNFIRDLYRIDLTGAAIPARIPRSTCGSDTLYVPRRVAVDAAGRVVLGTRQSAFSVREGGQWFCPPPLGPHSPTIADLALAPDGTLYFGTGDKNRLARANGLGIYDGTRWRSLTPNDDPEMLEFNTTEVAVWPDTTVWFGSTRNADLGGLNHYYPKTDSLTKYHDDVVELDRRTQGRNIWSLELDSESNLWVAYGQSNGGLSVIEYPSLQVTNYPFASIFSTTTLLRDIAFDSRGRVWVSTSSSATQPGQLYVVDHRGTLSDLSDDIYSQFNVANDIEDIAPIPFLAIDSSDRIWLAGEKGLVVGQIGPDVAGAAAATWQLVPGTSSQLGGRNPLPYTAGRLDWEENLWLGTESAGLVRISKDLTRWTWFDQIEGCPLPDQAVAGVFMDRVARRVYVGTATAGIAVVDLSGVGSMDSAGLDPRPFPNPWRPNSDGVVTLAGIPADETTTVRFYTVAGELVHEADAVRGAKTWDGRNLGGQVVEAGIYVITATSTNGSVYEGKVAVIR